MGFLDDVNFNFSFGDDNEGTNADDASVASNHPDSGTIEGTSSGPSPLSDEDILRLFGEMVEAVKQDEETARIAAEAVEAEAEKILKDATHDEMLAQKSLVDAEVAELEKKLSEVKQRQRQINREMWDIKVESAALDKKKNEKIRAARVAASAYVAAKQIEKSLGQLEERAKNFKWFTGITQGDKTLKCLPHQWDAMQFMATGKRVILGDGMGLGKTLSALGTLDLTEAKRVLIITPADITTNFLHEANFWTGHRPTMNLRGMRRTERSVILDTLDYVESFTVILNYESWRRDHKMLVRLASLGFDTIICDEAHNLKETDTDAYKGVVQVAHASNYCPMCNIICKPTHNLGIEAGRKCPQCGWEGGSFETDVKSWDEKYWMTRSVKNIYLLTGTPILNKPADLYALLSIIDPTNFDNKNAFLREYAEQNTYTGKWGFARGGESRLFGRLRGKFLARSLEDAGIVLPPQNPIIHQLELDPVIYAEQARIIEQIEKFAEVVFSEDKKASITDVIAQITRQRQANVYPGGIVFREPKTLPNGMPNPNAGEVMWRVGDEVQQSIKLDKTVELIQQFTAEGQRVVVFSQFSAALRELQLRVNGAINDNGDPISSVVFDGSTPDSIRSEIKTNFDKKMGEEKKWDVVLANYKTGGTGLNLTAATHTIILDREWNPGKENQALARTHRIGQDQTTFVHILEIPDTIDEWMNEIINHKANMLNGFNASAEELKDELLKKLRRKK